MSSVNTVSPAPWRDAFISHLEESKQSNFTLSSLHSTSPSLSSTGAPQFAPRARTVVYRGMWASLTPNPKNPAQLNPACYESDLPTITTDARMEKVLEMFQTLSPLGASSGMGGPVEAVFWFSEAMTQWRLRGRICMIGPDIDSDAASSSSAREALVPYMRPVGNTDQWSWTRELTAQFGNLSPLMRGTFRNPPPGTPITAKVDEGLRLGQTVEDLEDGIARSNFRVLVIIPEEVDRVDLSDPERGRRWNYTLNGEGGLAQWKETELWP